MTTLRAKRHIHLVSIAPNPLSTPILPILLFGQLYPNSYSIDNFKYSFNSLQSQSTSTSVKSLLSANLY